MTNNLIALGGAAFLVVVFVRLLFLFQAPAHLRRVLVVSEAAAATLRNPLATDEEKEKIAQRSSIRLFGLFLLILASFAGALLAPVSVLWVLDLAHLLSLKAIIATSTSVDFLVACTAIGCAVAFLWPRLRAGLANGRQ